MNEILSPELPELSDANIRRIEHSLFAQIAAEQDVRAQSERPARSRRRGWLTVGGVAAAFLVGVLVTPPILDAVGGSGPRLTGVSTSADGGTGGEIAEVPGLAPPMNASGGDIQADGGGHAPGLTTEDAADREIIASAQATVRVDEIATASDAVSTLARNHGGYVESTNLGSVEGYRQYDGVNGSAPVVPGGDYGWITIRVPADALTSVIAELKDIGTVTASSLSRQDVTSVAIDLRARVAATRASVERLTELMSQTGSVSELIEAEVALSERQAQLESYEQQLAALDSQITMSSLTVSLERIRPVTTPEPAGFGDGLTAGWDGLIVSLNALVVVAGFVLPWLALLGVVIIVVWSIRRWRRRGSDSQAARSA